MHHSRKTHDDDDATVRTDNTSDSRSSVTTTDEPPPNPWQTVPRRHSPPTPAESTTSPLTVHNYYSALDDDTIAIASGAINLTTGSDRTDIVVDSGASDNFGKESTVGTDRRLSSRGITMATASGDCRHSIGTDAFNLPLPPASRPFHLFRDNDLQRPLLSVGKACDAGCKVEFTRDDCTFTCDGKLLLTGYRDPATKLYLLPTRCSQDDLHVPAHHRHTKHQLNITQPLGLGLPPQSPQLGLSAYTIQTVPALVRYLHACAGFPTATTWSDAINRGYYLSWPGLTSARVNKHLPKSEITSKGHLKLIRQGIRPTSKGAKPQGYDSSKGGNPSKGGSPDEKPTSLTIGRQRNVIACSVPTKDLRGIIGTDQTGAFPATSTRKHKYVFILYDTDTEYIYGVPIKSRKATELVRAYQEAYDVLKDCGFEPVLHRIDHETSKELMRAIKERNLKYEVAPPANHRVNQAERAIQTFKSHFISIINGLDHRFPQGAWDLLLDQVNITLNLLRPCRVNPKHSAQAYIHGAYNFDAHPLAPLGCRAVVHERSIKNGGTRGSWGNRGKIGYYIGPALDSYRTWRFYMPDTKRVHESDTAEFFPNIPMPSANPAAEITEGLERIRKALQEPIPQHHYGDELIIPVIERLKEMYAGAPITEDAPKPRKTIEYKAAAPTEDTHTTINSYKPQRRQRYRLGTRVKVNEGRKSFIGTVQSYEPTTGMYHVVFTDGEWEDFDETEITAFRYQTTANHASTYTYELNDNDIRSLFTVNTPRTAYYADDVIHMSPQKRHASEYGLNAGSIFDDELECWMAYRDLIKHPNPKIRERWNQAGINEFSRLAQGYNGTKGLNVVTFIRARDMPRGKQATYARYVVDYRPEKDEPWRLRITCGGDKLPYDGDTTTHAASMETIKCQLNSIISTPNAKAATADISNMYLASDLPEAEYVRFRMELIPEAIKEAYHLRSLATPNGFIYARVNKAWYGLKQAGKIAHDDLVQRLSDSGYKKADLVEGYFAHETRDINFTLVVDDFLIKYTKDEDLQHLRDAIGQHYTLKVDTDAKQYVGINLEWDYEGRTVVLSMDGYVTQALKELEHVAPRTPYYGPSKYTTPKYGKGPQMATVDMSAALVPTEVRHIQRVIGKLLYYARAVDPTMLHAINDISLYANKGTAATLDATTYLLNYAHTYPETSIVYRASDMVLRIDSDAAYLVASEARSRAGGYHYLSNTNGTLFNGPVLVLAKVIKNVMASAAEAELGALFMNAQEAVALRNCLETMGHKQPATPLKTDNNTANGIINNTMQQRRSKAIDMRFYWLRDRVKQNQFHIFWDPGRHNLADYPTKHHSPQHHRQVRPIYTYIKGISPVWLQGCIEILKKAQPKRVNPIPKGGTAATSSASYLFTSCSLNKRRRLPLH